MDDLVLTAGDEVSHTPRKGGFGAFKPASGSLRNPSELCSAQNIEVHGILFVSHIFLPPLHIAKKENVIATECRKLRECVCV